MIYTVHFVLCAHHLSVGIKRNLLNPCKNIPKHIFVKSDMLKCFKQSVLGRVAYSLSVNNTRIVVKNHIVKEMTVAFNIEVELILKNTFAVHIDFLNSHFILCERTRLIGADYRHTTKAFNSFQILDNGIFFCHFLRTHCLNNCND